MNKLKVALVCFLGGSIAAGAHAVEDAEADDSLAKRSQNPISSLISVPFENNFNVNSGPDERNQNALLIKPVVPIKISENWSLINRLIVPVLSQPTGSQANNNDDRKDGMGDITYQGFFTPAASSDVIWGIGPQIQIPTHTNKFIGSNKTAAGPSLVLVTMPGKWVMGTLLSQIWDVAGPSNADDISKMTLQPFVNYNFGGGWYLISAPVITANWEKKNKNKWTVPLGGGIGRVMHWGKQAVNLRLAYYKNVVRPDNAAEYNIQMSFMLLFPK
jgi:hypothetical protein